MKSIPLKELATKIHFNKMKVEELKKSPSFNLVDNEGNFVAMVIIPISGEKRMQLEGLASQMNAALGG